MVDFEDQVRGAITGLVYPTIQTMVPDMPIAFDNAPFDRNSLPDLWAEFEVVFDGGRQLGPSASPKTRRRGQVHVSVYLREGMGTKRATWALGAFRSLLAYAYAGRAVLGEPQDIPEPPGRGWYIRSLQVPFYADET